MEHRIAPLIGRQLAQILAEGEPFKGRVVGVFDVQGILEGIFQPKGDDLPTCYVDDLNGHPVEAVREKQNLKRRVENVPICPRLANVDLTVSFKVNTQMV